MPIASICRLLCPKCRQGRVFRGVYRMNPACPECGLDFEPEAGYFLGAMYFSYALGLAAAAPLCVLLMLLQVSSDAIVWAVFAEMALLSPLLFSYSRVMWLHLDQAIQPR